jgi:hypothetical protein
MASACGPVVLASEAPLDWPAGIAVDSANVYWTNAAWAKGSGWGSVMTVPIGGGSPTVLASGLDAPTGIAMTATHVYWASSSMNGAVMRVPLAGGTPTAIATGLAMPAGIAVDAANVYWTNSEGGTVMKAPLDGGAITVLASNQSGPHGIVVDAANVYWNNQYGTVASAMMKVPIGGGVPVTLATAIADAGIALGGADVYWATYSGGPMGSGGSLVQRAPIGGGTTSTVGAVGGLGGLGPQTAGIAVDATSVYWAHDAGSVVRVLVGSGTAIPLVPWNGASHPRSIALDAVAVYWTNSGDDRVMKVAKPP